MAFSKRFMCYKVCLVILALPINCYALQFPTFDSDNCLDAASCTQELENLHSQLTNFIPPLLSQAESANKRKLEKLVLNLRLKVENGLHKLYNDNNLNKKTINSARKVSRKIHDLKEIIGEWSLIKKLPINGQFIPDIDIDFTYNPFIQIQNVADLQSGDLLILRANPEKFDFMTSFMVAFSKSAITHVALLYRDPITHKLNVLTTWSPKLARLIPFKKFISNYTGRINIMRARTKQDSERLRKGAEIGALKLKNGAKIKFDYTLNDNPNNPKKYCTSLIYSFAELGGFEMLPYAGYRWELDSKFKNLLVKAFDMHQPIGIWPGDFAFDPRLRTVAQGHVRTHITKMRVEEAVYEYVFAHLEKFKGRGGEIPAVILATLASPWGVPYKAVKAGYSYYRQTRPMFKALFAIYSNFKQKHQRPMTMSEMEKEMVNIFNRYNKKKN